MPRPSWGRPARVLDRVRDGGAGGSHGYADTATGIAFALTKTRLTAADHAAEQDAAVVAAAVAGR